MPAPALRARCRATDESVAVAKRRELAALQNTRRLIGAVELFRCSLFFSPDGTGAFYGAGGRVTG
ncbi:MAG: hypothetical protein LBV28_00655, partial [Puniceicoccales bacterium]|nr:hypothetical protein [Puniceicoccales bacterium]